MEDQKYWYPNALYMPAGVKIAYFPVEARRAGINGKAETFVTMGRVAGYRGQRPGMIDWVDMNEQKLDVIAFYASPGDIDYGPKTTHPRFLPQEKLNELMGEEEE